MDYILNEKENKLEANLEEYKFIRKLKDQDFMSINDWKKFEDFQNMQEDKVFLDLDNVDTSGLSEQMKANVSASRIKNKEIKKNSKKRLEDLLHIFSYFSDEELNHPNPIELFIQEKIELVSKMTNIDIETVKKLFSIFKRKHDFVLSKGYYEGRGYLDKYRFFPNFK